TFGILLVNEETNELEMKVAVRYGDSNVNVPRVKLGHGLVGYAALHKVAVNVPDVSVDPRYIKVVDDARSELVIPLMVQDRCIGVFDLESPELDAFGKSQVEIVTLLPTELPKRLKHVDVAARFAPARELGGDLYDFLAPEPNSLVVAVGDVSG